MGTNFSILFSYSFSFFFFFFFSLILFFLFFFLISYSLKRFLDFEGKGEVVMCIFDVTVIFNQPVFSYHFFLFHSKK